ncbi:1-acyl-sn-glycerol-3-phosphate acyltransferase [Saprospiraceae bacterium]|nr:1-acyl-sn-glycerol-3-phosphate acyltransferase [bacterium]MDC1508408.1 1-acyl-sn-glycerol-3-phosphate acyltransferase [Saprospiraceae bacterium]HAV28670.1 glycerol acyltransferase [Saprospirales bacterium]
MKNTVEHIIPNMADWPISQFGEKRGEFVFELNDFVLKKILDSHRENLEPLLAKTIYLEKKRSKNNRWRVDPEDEVRYWSSLSKELNQVTQDGGTQGGYLELLKRIINRYDEEIVGTFKPKTYKFTFTFLNIFFKRLLNTAAGRNHKRLWGSRHQLVEKLKVYGEVDKIKALFDQGTVVMVPTHFSNLDSMVIGYAMQSAVGIPAFSFGAGLNLFDNEIVGYFINRLGAYRVDRRKKNPIYLECLTSMAAYSIQKGVNNLFFPGGTRSREGGMEDRLKLGLLGSSIEAQRNMVIEGKKEKVFIVPMILGYNFVLEAKFLIEQHLARTGKEKYIKSKDAFKSYRKIIKFIWSLFSEKSDISVSFGEPMDIMGNFVDDEGNSIDINGEHIDLRDYFSLDGEVKANAQRENVYTKILGDRILDSYKRNNVVLSSHLLAYSAFKILEKSHDGDVYSLVNLPKEKSQIEWDYLETIITRLQVALLELESKGKIKLSREVKWEPRRLIEDGIKNLGIYHAQKPLLINNDKVWSDSLKVLYYYHNRIKIYDLDKYIEWTEATLET